MVAIEIRDPSVFRTFLQHVVYSTKHRFGHNVATEHKQLHSQQVALNPAAHFLPIIDLWMYWDLLTYRRVIKRSYTSRLRFLSHCTFSLHAGFSWVSWVGAVLHPALPVSAQQLCTSAHTQQHSSQGAASSLIHTTTYSGFFLFVFPFPSFFPR